MDEKNTVNPSASSGSETSSSSEKPPAVNPKNSTKTIFIAFGVIIVILLGGLSYIGYQHMSQKGGIPATSNNMYTQQNTGNTPEEKKNICSTPYGQIEAPLSSATGAFKAALTNTTDIAVISPGKLVGDPRFTYLWIKGGKSVPVFAPADGVLVQIFYKTRSDLSSDLSKPDYDLVFYVDCHTMYRINHITNPIEKIASQTPITAPLQLKPGSGYDNRDTLPKQHITVRAGEQIGTTTGTAAAHNFDFGVFVDSQSSCPYNQFTEPIKSNFLALLGNTSTPIKGTACDVSGNY